MARFFAFISVIMLSAPVLAAEGPPQLDVKATCNAVTPAQAQDQSPQESCMSDERQAQDVLQKQWTKYPAALRDRCVSETNIGGYPSYVEVLTCIQVASGTQTMPPSTTYRRPQK